MNEIKAIIFDLGQVIVDVNHQKTFRAFEKIGNTDKDRIQEIFQMEEYFLYELGKITNKEFFVKIKEFILSENVDITDIAEAWDAMIHGVPEEGITLLKYLKGKIPLFALSNTNYSHVKAINRHLLINYNITDIQELFDKIYFSCEINIGKPDKKIFEYVLSDIKIQSNNILFIDDNLENINTASKSGFQTIHLVHRKQLTDELKKLGMLNF